MMWKSNTMELLRRVGKKDNQVWLHPPVVVGLIVGMVLGVGSPFVVAEMREASVDRGVCQHMRTVLDTSPWDSSAAEREGAFRTEVAVIVHAHIGRQASERLVGLSNRVTVLDLEAVNLIHDPYYSPYLQQVYRPTKRALVERCRSVGVE